MTNAVEEKKGNGPKDRDYKIQIDRSIYEVEEDVLTGAQLRTLPTPDVGPERDLFQIVPGEDDLKIELTDDVTMRNGLRFFTAPAHINPGKES